MKCYRIVIAAAAACILGSNAFAQTPKTRTTAAYSVPDDEMVASGFFGSSFAADADQPSAQLGGSLAWLAGERFGAEVLLGFAPNFDMRNGAFGDPVQLNHFMFNVIGAGAAHGDHEWQPFISGGLGALNLRSDELTRDLGFEDSSQTSLGFNLGGGLMGFWDRWGLRGDLRYLRDLSADNDSPLDKINFWQGTVGVAYRW